MSDEDLQLIAAGFTAILGVHVVHGPAGQGLPKLTIRNVFHCTYTIPRSLCNFSSQDVFHVHVKRITGATTMVQVHGDYTVAELKTVVERETNIPGRDQRLMFDGKRLEDDQQTISELGITPCAEIFLIVRTRGGGPEYQLDTEELDSRYHYDFTNQSDDGKTYMRGGKPYKRPYGWKRFAVKVLNVYESNTWLGPSGMRTEEAPGEWPVSYHGTNLASAKAIMSMGYKIGPRQRFGKAVYSSPSLDMVESHGYAKKFEHEGDYWLVALQNRVNPESGHLVVVDEKDSGTGAEYWLSPKQDIDKGVFDIRPYGVLFKKVGSGHEAMNTKPQYATYRRNIQTAMGTKSQCGIM